MGRSALRRAQMPSVALVFDFALCLLLTALFFVYFNRIVRFCFTLTVIASKLGVSFGLAITIHTLLQFSRFYVSVTYRDTQHKFGFVRAFAKTFTELASAAAARSRGGDGEDL